MGADGGARWVPNSSGCPKLDRDSGRGDPSGYASQTRLGVKRMGSLSPGASSSCPRSFAPAVTVRWAGGAARPFRCRSAAAWRPPAALPPVPGRCGFWALGAIPRRRQRRRSRRGPVGAPLVRSRGAEADRREQTTPSPGRGAVAWLSPAVPLSVRSPHDACCLQSSRGPMGLGASAEATSCRGGGRRATSLAKAERLIREANRSGAECGETSLPSGGREGE
jgi:hypothetical protein